MQAKLQTNPHRLALPNLFVTNARSLINGMGKILMRIISHRRLNCVSVVTENLLDNKIPDYALGLVWCSMFQADWTAASAKHRVGGY